MRENIATEKDIAKVVTTLADSFDAELMECEEQDLEKYWHYMYDPMQPVEINLYHFYDMLKLYNNYCRRWESAKNGTCCVVERVRDKYLMPKIRKFLELTKQEG